MIGDDDAGEYASPPCFMHELDSAWLGFEAEPDERQRRDVARWRKAERDRLLQARRAMGEEERRAAAVRIAATLDSVIAASDARIIGIYWPIRCEPDLRDWMARQHVGGISCALPSVTEKAASLSFRPWTPEQKMRRGAWRIPEPDTDDSVAPDLLVVPLLGFDRHGYRLGNGGGYYDRTLAGLAERPRLVGVGYAGAEIPTIYPQPHDIPMSHIVTEVESFPASS